MQKDTRTPKKHGKLITLVITIVLISAVASSGLFAYFYLTDYGVRPEVNARAHNIILLIGDGMGKDHIKAAEAFGTTAFERFDYFGNMETRSFNLFPTDSAAAATALATGQKTYNGRISYYNGKNLTHFGEVAKSLDKKVGIITTKSVTDATPAAFSSHNKSRSNQDDIALQQIRKSDLDVLFGLGQEYFDPYAGEINTSERGYYNDYQSLMAGEKERAFAIFGEDIPHSGAFTLSSLTSKALMMLENDDGFFLMVEGAKIDTYSHERDMDKMLEEFWSFNDAVRVALDYASMPGSNTTVIVTADHETGKLTLPKDIEASQINDSYFRSSGHSARDVSYYIKGAGANEIPSTIDNTDIFFILCQLFGG
ncbi:MAG: alkaline phosphatase [Clostridia bacterium]